MQAVRLLYGVENKTRGSKMSSRQVVTTYLLKVFGFAWGHMVYGQKPHRRASFRRF